MIEIHENLDISLIRLVLKHKHLDVVPKSETILGIFRAARYLKFEVVRRIHRGTHFP